MSFSTDASPPSYSATNPLAYNAKVNALISEINGMPAHTKELEGKIKNLKDEILTAVQPDTIAEGLKKAEVTPPPKERLIPLIPFFEDEAARQINDLALRQMLRKELKLVKEGDVICDQSQGLFPNGKNACAVICWHAAERYLTSGPPKTESQVYELIKKGIGTYEKLIQADKRVFGDSGTAFFEDLHEKLSDASGKSTLRPVVPERLDFVNNLALIRDLGGAIPFSGDSKTDFPATLKALQDTNRLQKTVGVITCNGETVVVGFDEKGKPTLFDSHGRTYQGVAKGASVLTFDSVDALAEHLSSKLFAKAVPKEFTCMFVASSKVEKPQEKPLPPIPEPTQEAIMAHAATLAFLERDVAKVLTLLTKFFGEHLKKVPELPNQLKEYISKLPPLGQGPSEDDERMLRDAITGIDGFIFMKIEPMEAIKLIAQRMRLNQDVTFRLIQHYFKTPQEGALPESVNLLVKEYQRQPDMPLEVIFDFITGAVTGLTYMQQRALVVLITASERKPSPNKKGKIP